MLLSKIFAIIVFVIGLGLFFGAFGAELRNDKEWYLYLMALGSAMALGVTGFSLMSGL